MTEAAQTFRVVAAGFAAGLAAQAGRGGFELEEEPAPRKLAPFAVAAAGTASRDDDEVAWARLVLLYDPQGQQGWTGCYRMVAYIRAEVEPEMAADPLLGEVGWSWLTDALEVHAPGYGTPSGTVTRTITQGFGAKEDDEQVTSFELRASWSPADGAAVQDCVAAWCDLLAAAAGLPPQPPGTRALSPSGGRRL